MRILIYVLLTMLLYDGCDEGVSFNQAQPVDTKSLNEFPKKVCDSYLANDSTCLKIGKDIITNTNDYDIKVAKKDLDSSYRLVNDTVYTTNTREKVPVKIEGDTLLAHIHTVDTIFHISDKNVLKYYKGYYFLNFDDSASWEVKKLALSKGILSISAISADDEIKNLREITEAGNDTCYNQFHPSKKQFKTFVTKGGFKDAEYYKRVGG